MKIFGREFFTKPPVTLPRLPEPAAVVARTDSAGPRILRTPPQPIERRNNFRNLQDIVPEVGVKVASGKLPAVIPGVMSPVLTYQNSRFVGRGFFRPSEYNLAEIGRIEDTESYVARSFNKKVSLMFKEGWDFNGANANTVAYIKMRLAQIARATNVPTVQLFRSIGEALIKKSNAFLVKVRDVKASGGKVREIDIGDGPTPLEPIAGYFVSPAETMEFQIENGQITAWRQNIPGGIYRIFDILDILHFYYDRKEGFVFGTPSLTPVIDDIRALRKIEENIELLVYQYLFPLFQYKVGTEERPAGYTENNEREVDVVRREIMMMPSEGGIVTTERHDIKAIGSEGRALRAEGYLTHFKNRVIAGLGISAVDLGDGDTANRATADNMSRNLIDAVKDFQQVMEFFVNEFIVAELLLESSFGEDVLNEENRVWIKFKEIDLNSQIKKEAHYADQFNKDVITLDEARMKMGYEPMRIPTPEEIESEQDLHEQYPGWYKTRWKLFEEPKLLIQAMDEPYSAAAKSVANSRSTELTQKGLDEHAKGMEADKKGDQKHEMQVAKMKKPAPKPAAKKPAKKATSRKDAYVAETFNALKNDVVERMTLQPENDNAWLLQMVRSGMERTVDHLVADQFIAFQAGYSTLHQAHDEDYFREAKVARGLFSDRANKYIHKLVDDLVSSMRRNGDSATTTRAVFDALAYRVKYIEEFEALKAYNYGKLVALRIADAQHAHLVCQDDACQDCNHEAEIWSVKDLHFETIPPLHPNCRCRLEVVDINGATHQDSDPEDPPEEMHEKELVSFCLNCGKTAMRLKDTPDIYNCRACGKSFRKPVQGAQNNG